MRKNHLLPVVALALALIQPAQAAKNYYNQFEFVGKVVTADYSPGTWSGTDRSYKPIEFKVMKVVKGNIGEKFITVNETLLGPNGRVTRAAALSKDFYRPGRQLVVAGSELHNQLFIEKVKPYNAGEPQERLTSPFTQPEIRPLVQTTEFRRTLLSSPTR